MEAFEKAEQRSAERAEGLLADCEIRNLKNGTVSGRKLNKVGGRSADVVMRILMSRHWRKRSIKCSEGKIVLL